MSAPLTIERNGNAHLFTLNRPDKRNALSAELVEALIEGVETAHAAGASVLVFRGVGKNFSAGFDFADVQSQSEGDLLLRFVRIEALLDLVASSPCATLAFAHGRNFGAGVDLFAACRHRIATADASFRMPGLKFGLVLGTRRFGAIVGAERAREVLEASRSFDAEQALSMGFVQRLIEAEAWPALQQEIAATADALEPVARSALHRVLGRRDAQADTDLAELVRSAARPGLKARVARYLAAG